MNHKDLYGERSAGGAAAAVGADGVDARVTAAKAGMDAKSARHCRELGIAIAGEALLHLIYDFVLSYSNWETGSICYSESFESLSEDSQQACGSWEGRRASIGRIG